MNISKSRNFFKNLALPLFDLYSLLISCKKSDKSFEPFLRNLHYQTTNQPIITNNINLIGPCWHWSNSQNLTLKTYHKLTYTGLLLNLKSFTSFSYKIKCLTDKSFKICNNWNYFLNNIENIKSNLIKNAYPPFLIDKVNKKYLNYKFSSDQNQL